MNVSFTPQAVDDLRSIHSHIAEYDPNTADRIISRIRQAIDILAAFPLLGRQGVVAGSRELAIAGLPYTIVYSATTATHIDILTVIHQRRQYPPLNED
ncbi:type II toxin-antitoxin system RelE/ParE family toxin [Rhizobium sp. CG5]|uniref:type II toxin-antitoxin system RelE/ParE family toxin n=1 Tax=Rhizobium sp. CG5 TaxID=2726076 RepID=UPI00203376CD|nr:type II toxin-antitoxin system RelE/ParE family toxin [Rhizobium sp. CG5]MCM2473785.1 type II toxin-antitoxin system RelE/ParE family toxin [Rhizobium sp. CG5]